MKVEIIVERVVVTMNNNPMIITIENIAQVL